jgi:hypothetical protein
MVLEIPRTTDCSHFTMFTFDLCRRSISSALISFSFADMPLANSLSPDDEAARLTGRATNVAET